jgi:hypothetical protein
MWTWRINVIRRINGHKTPEVAVTAVENVTLCVQELMKLLGPRDFEMLVDLVFTNSGWRRYRGKDPEGS